MKTLALVFLLLLTVGCGVTSKQPDVNIKPNWWQSKIVSSAEENNEKSEVSNYNNVKSFVFSILRVGMLLGAIGLIAGGILGYTGNKLAMDVLIISGGVFSSCIALSVFWTLVIWIIGAILICSLGYIGYNIYLKLKNDKLADELVKRFELTKNDMWGSGKKKIESEHNIEWVNEQVKRRKPAAKYDILKSQGRI